MPRAFLVFTNVVSFLHALKEKKMLLHFFRDISHIQCCLPRSKNMELPYRLLLQQMVKGRTQTHGLVAWQLATWPNAKQYHTPVSGHSELLLRSDTIQHSAPHSALQTQFDSSYSSTAHDRTQRRHAQVQRHNTQAEQRRLRWPPVLYMAYLWVQVLAVFSYLCRSVLYMCAISGTRGSSGFGSVSREQMDSNTLDIVSAGLHWSLRMSRQMLPLLLMFGWNTLVRNATCTLHSIDQGHMLWNRGLWIVRMHGYSAWRMNSWTWEIFKLAHEWLESQTTRTYSVAITRWII